MDSSVPVTMVLPSCSVWVDLWRSGHMVGRQNHHIVVQLGGRDCLLSPILLQSNAVPIGCEPVNSNSADITCLKWL